MLALRLVAADRLREAFEVTELALHREGDDADVWFVHGRILHKLHDHEAAREALTRALRLAPGWREPWKVLLRVLAAARRRPGAARSPQGQPGTGQSGTSTPRVRGTFSAARTAWGLPRVSDTARSEPTVARCPLAA